MKIQNKKYTQLVLIGFAGLLLACGNASEEQANDHTDSAKTESITLSLEQMQSVGITLGAMEQHSLDSGIKVNGQLAVPPQNRADISVLLGGIMSDIRVVEGQEVKKGQLLASINNQELIKIQQDYLVTKNNFSFVKAEYERQTQLKEAGAGTGKSFQLAEANYHGELSRIAAYESQLRQLGVSVTNVTKGKMIKTFPVLSPINGTIGRININTGAFVQPGASIMEVVDHSKIHCDLMVFEKDLGKVRIGQKVNLQLTNQDNRQISGKISGINKSFENESKVVVVHAVIDPTKDKNLIPGMYVTALIHTGEKLVSALPLDAVVYAGGKPYIFVAEPDKKEGLYHFKKTAVKTGITENGYIEIVLLKSLAPGTQIVNKGAFYLESKAAGAQEH